MKRFRLQFPTSQIEELAARYEYVYGDEALLAMVPHIRSRGYFTKDEFLQFCEWKSPRARPHYQANSTEYVEAVTQIALSTGVERLRIDVLMLLAGVRLPTASALLHFAHPDPYPIYDVRALEALGVERSYTTDTFDFWWAYTCFCRQLAQKNRVSMRVLDRALWQYSKERSLAQK